MKKKFKNKEVLEQRPLFFPVSYKWLITAAGYRKIDRWLGMINFQWGPNLGPNLGPNSCFREVFRPLTKGRVRTSYSSVHFG